MPIKLQQGFDPLAYYGRREDGWRLQRVEAQDGLNPTQITRYFEAPEGIDFSEATALPFIRLIRVDLPTFGTPTTIARTVLAMPRARAWATFFSALAVIRRSTCLYCLFASMAAQVIPRERK